MSDFTSITAVDGEKSGFTALPIEVQRVIIGVGFVIVLLVGGGIRQFIIRKREESRFNKANG